MQITLYVMNVYPNIMMIFYNILIETPLYKDLNVTIHHQWTSLFILHMNSKSKILIFNNASSNNYDFDNEEIHYTLIDSTIHNFLDSTKIMDYENTIYFIAPSQNFHIIGLFKNKHAKELNFSSIILWATSINFLRFFISTNSTMGITS